MAAVASATITAKFAPRSAHAIGCGRLAAATATTRWCSAGTIVPASFVIVATAETIPGKTIKEYRGLAIGSTVRTRDVTKDLTSAVRAVFGGELPHYTQLMSDTREEAILRLQEHAANLGANGVVSLRMTTSNIAQSASEVMAYGTAVVLE
eukprot:TRINITY_DN48490_c0_g1_i1.p1 TRINITY_DN48490_c0_g1~~TRINITY_DN48490_c0_g1_i1.p1  ORF type:complete len:151 (+),score=21.54 TRINITY_DN48490_c0_g1_i1:70-522(+)